MANISLHIDADGPGDLYDTLERLLAGQAGHYQQMVPLRSAPATAPYDVRANRPAPDDRRAETVEAVTGTTPPAEDLKPVRGKNADDLAAELIDNPDRDDFQEQLDRLPKKHQDNVTKAIKYLADNAESDDAPADTFPFVDGDGDLVDNCDDADTFVSLLEDAAAKAATSDAVLALAKANAETVKRLSAEDQKRLEDAFGEALKAAKPKTEAPAAAEAEKPAEPAKEVTIDDVRAAVTEVANTKGMDTGRAVVTETGEAAKISEIDPALYPAVLAKCAELMGKKG